MIIMELSQFEDYSGGNPYEPFVYSSLAIGEQLPAFWTDTFGASSVILTETVRIGQFVRGGEENYSEVDSVQDCIDQEQTFFFDFNSQVLYIHFEHEHEVYTDFYEYGALRGFSQGRPIYLNDTFYDPLIISIPGFSQQQDIIGQDKLSFINGNIVLNNRGGVLDSLIGSPIYGNSVYLRWLDDLPGITDYYTEGSGVTITTPIDLVALYVEDYDFTLSEISLRVQDVRKSQNVAIPTDLFDDDDYPDIDDKYASKAIPVAYGEIRASEAIPVNGAAGSGTVTYRQALLLTSIGTVYVQNDDNDWIEKTPSSTDLTNGSFVLAEADARKTSGDPRECRVEGSVGISVTYASDIIKDLNQRYLGTVYNDSNYDTAEWESEETNLSAVGVLFRKQVKLFEAIRQIQSGANILFRYEILPDGRRTIRANLWTRDNAFRVSREEIFDADVLSVETNSELLAASVEIEYSHDFHRDEYLSVRNSDYRDSVISVYRQRPQQTFQTLLPSSTLASERAAWDSERLSEIRGISTVTIMKSDFLSLRIYDMIEIEVTPGLVGLGAIRGRVYWGVWTAQVLSIDPDANTGMNTITAVLVEFQDQTEYEIGFRVTADEIVRVTADGDNRIFFIEG